MYSDDLARPTFTPFIVEAEYVWVDCDLPGFYSAFKVEVRANLKNRERKRLYTEINEINAEAERIAEHNRLASKAIETQRADAIEAADTEAITEAIEASADLLFRTAQAFDENTRKIHELITPYVRNWNAGEIDEHGNEVNAAPPMVAGVDAFEAIDNTMTQWIVGTLLRAYRGGKGLSNSSPTPDELAEQPSASPEPTSKGKPKSSRRGKPQPSATNSGSPSPSTLTA
jgi:hypothetical protein